MSTRFRGGAQSGSHWPVSTPCPPNRTCGFPASGSPVGTCLSHAERRFGVTLTVPMAYVSPAFQRLHGLTRAVSLAVAPPGLFTPRRHRVSRPGPFAYACDASELSAPSRGVRRRRHSRGLSLLRHPSTPEAPSLGGYYPASPVLRASPPPCRPGLPFAGSRLPRARAPAGLPVLLRFPSSMRADATTPAETGRCLCRSLPSRSAAFPYSQEGRLPRHPFRGLLSVHSRSGLHGRRAAQGGPLTSVLQSMSLPP